MGDHYYAELTIPNWPGRARVSPELVRALEPYLEHMEYNAAGGAPAAFEAAGALVIADEQANHGGEEFTEDTEIPELLRAEGLGYTIADEGLYEHPGVEVAWHPGMETERRRSVLGGGAIALGEGDYRQLVHEARDEDGEINFYTLATAVGTYFSPLPLPVVEATLVLEAEAAVTTGLDRRVTTTPQKGEQVNAETDQPRFVVTTSTGATHQFGSRTLEAFVGRLRAGNAHADEHGELVYIAPEHVVSVRAVSGSSSEVEPSGAEWT